MGSASQRFRARPGPIRCRSSLYLQHTARRGLLAVQIKLPPVAKDFIQKLLCNVDDRLGSRGGASEVKVCLCHPAHKQ